MSHNTHEYHVQQIEQLITTVATCRGVVKYNLALNDEQKKELLTDIDQALEILRVHLINSQSAQPVQQAPQPTTPTQTDALAPAFSSPGSSYGFDNLQVPPSVSPQSEEQQKLQALYRMYRSYLDMNQNNNISTFVTRFNEAMATINDIQHMSTPDSHSLYSRSNPIEEQLQSIRVFIADLYYIFMEFMRALSDTLQQNNVQLDTEKLRSLPGERSGAINKTLQQPQQLISLFDVYASHQKIQEKRGQLNGRIGDATAFLEFLKEGINAEANKREEILSQLNNIIRLIQELSYLLTNYEQATATIFSIR